MLALLQIDKWRLLVPVKNGDTIHMVSKVVGKQETSKPDRGVITFERKVINQAGIAVQELEACLMYRRRPVAV